MWVCDNGSGLEDNAGLLERELSVEDATPVSTVGNARSGGCVATVDDVVDALGVGVVAGVEG